MSSDAALVDIVENEAYFRQQNERVRKNFEEIVRLAEDSGQEYLIRRDDAKLHFYCECADENCSQRVIIKASTYNRIHSNRRRFVIIPGHEVLAVEQVIHDRKTYYIVEKLMTPPETDLSLNVTDVHNT